MLIKEWMSKSVATIDCEDSLINAAKIFRTRMISMLPVMENNELAGIITNSDIKKAMPSDAAALDRFELASVMDEIKIKSVMSKPAITIPEDHTVDEAADIMLAKSISGMPVTDAAGRMVGVLTKNDIFRCFVSFTGVANKGQIFALKIQDKPRTIKTITDSIRDYGGRLCGIMASYDDMAEGFRKVYFHTFDIAPDDFDSLIRKFQATSELLYAADLSRNFRMIC